MADGTIKKGLKIVIPIIEFGPEGGYRTLSRLATEWIEMGATVDMVVCIDKAPYYPTTANIVLVNYKGKAVESQCEKCADKMQYRYLSIMRYLKKTKDRYDVVLANQNKTAFLAKHAHCKNIVYYIQAYEPDFYPKHTLKQFIQRRVAARTYGYRHVVRVVNADLYKNYKNLHSEHVVPPGMDLSVYYAKNTFWDGQSPLIIGCIGRTEAWKGSQDVADAFDILKNRGENVRFKVAFNPVECKHEYELSKPDGDENLSAFYRSLDVLVAPAKLQLGSVHYPVMEAMACGASVITTGYYPANEENSYLVPVSSPEAIANAVTDIMRNYGTAVHKTQNALKVIEQFDWKKVSKKFMDIMEAEVKRG